MQSREEIVKEILLDLRAVVDGLKYPTAAMIDDWDRKDLQPLLESPSLIAALVMEVGKRRKKSNLRSTRKPFAFGPVDDNRTI